ncbi:DNA primase DnaG [Geoglobus acetivorans]|uniref:DNA primase DnaG n=1 Tax=Geoglobus acetivorans TaxID=565033 RepID=A0A0A7GJH1_GEOAI|nr:DNA primase [Geoglobus acetivorans]
MKAPSDTTKYLIHAEIVAEGVVERPDVVGAIFGQTEGLLGDDLDLRELQKTGRIGRIEVKIESKSGKSFGEIRVPSSLDKIETAILAAALETIERVGPCAAKIKVIKIEDVRASKRKKIVERAKDILRELFEEPEIESEKIADLVRQAIRTEEIIEYGEDRLPAGPAIDESDAIIVVEGRADVLNLLKHGIKNIIAVEGTNIPKTIVDLSKRKTVTAFLDGDRGGDLILKELLQVADIDYVARAPEGKGVEDLTQKEIVKSLRNKIPVEQVHVLKHKDEKKEERKDVRETKVEQKEESEAAEKPKEEKKEDARDRANVIEMLRKHKQEIEGNLKARLIDSNFEVVREIPVRDLVKLLKSNNVKAHGIVFDGVITQRVVDLAAKRNINLLVGVKVGSVVKVPSNVNIMTFDQI